MSTTENNTNGCRTQLGPRREYSAPAKFESHGRILWVALLLAMVVLPAPASTATVQFTDSYLGWNLYQSRCTYTFPIIGKEPEQPGSYPLFIYVVATGGMYNSGEAMKFVSEMAARGYVAASVGYQSWLGNTPDTLDYKSNCIFNGAEAKSAVAVLCARVKADCSKGIGMAGFSQGAHLATRAKDFEPRIAAVYALGLADNPVSADYLDRLLPPKRALPTDRLRIVSGGNVARAEQREQVHLQLNALTGLGCPPTSNSCFRENGSGWYLVQNNEVKDGNADHCYFHGGYRCYTNPPFDPSWLPPSSNAWSLSTNLDWLQQFVTP